MESVAPLYQACLELRCSLSQNVPVRSSLHSIVASVGGDLGKQLQQILVYASQHKDPEAAFFKHCSFQRACFFQLALRGLKGEPILEPLQVLEKDIKDVSLEQVQYFLKTLPYKMLIPVMLLQLPAYMYVMFSPFLKAFSEGLQF